MGEVGNVDLAVIVGITIKNGINQNGMSRRRRFDEK